MMSIIAKAKKPLKTLPAGIGKVLKRLRKRLRLRQNCSRAILFAGYASSPNHLGDLLVLPALSRQNLRFRGLLQGRPTRPLMQLS
jgi:hypothetical protein